MINDLGLMHYVSTSPFSPPVATGGGQRGQGVQGADLGGRGDRRRDHQNGFRIFRKEKEEHQRPGLQLKVSSRHFFAESFPPFEQICPKFVRFCPKMASRCLSEWTELERWHMPWHGIL